jgi:NitT/TauT family transport system substrate-binding protein
VRRPLLRGLLALSLAPLLALTACGGNDPEPASNSGGGLEKTDIKVGVLPVLGVAPFYIALEKGYFKDEGLNVTEEVFKSGADAIPAMTGGSIDAVFTNYISLFTAQAKGVAKFRVIAEASNSAPNSFGIYVMPNSPIKDIKELAGKKIGVNAPNNIATVLVNETLSSAGVDNSTVQYQVAPFPQMGQLMESGAVDAAMLPEPFITQLSIQLGLKRIVDAGIGTLDGLPIDGYAATEGWVKQNPNTAAAFQRAIQRAAGTAGDRAEVEKVVQGYAKVDKNTAALVAPLQYPTSINPTRLQRVADLMLAQKLLEAKLDVGPFVGLST